ncbi:Fusaric acid resistance protein family protein [Aquimixticola soesokkakensis]|uniref:Fusaric acid resistance protein family protein n=1 Tax=Aquimixticola soesokkakensis TaxID=1519096 RepID=A0A1Y5RKN8_9RHOB|nr:FUSC family protein [Aquimixticola soesokkakensis]SLN19766.1 Fusaric acid resistance protein family protein [Aquimixticola soesokkakensis]
MTVFPGPVSFRTAQLFLAAAGALVLAQFLGLKHPYWAAMPVWVVSQAFREDLVIRAVLRVIGTLIGAALAISALTLTDGKTLHLLLMAFTVGVATATAYWIGTVFSYAAMLISITVAVIILPSLLLDHTVDSTVLALSYDRMFCTLIGVIAVTLTTFPFTPMRAQHMPLRVNHGNHIARRNGVIAAVVVLVGGAVVIWHPGVVTLSIAMGLAIFSTIIGSRPNPEGMLKNIVPSSMIGAMAGVAYRVVLDVSGMSGMEAIFVAIPFLAVGAYLRANPKTTLWAININIIFLLSAEVGTSGQALQVQVLSNIALIGAAGFMTALHWTILKLDKRATLDA